ncbi:kinase-like protein [Xylaria longipes]|nr:kinase-like protein [Xylaria longipes]
MSKEIQVELEHQNMVTDAEGQNDTTHGDAVSLNGHETENGEDEFIEYYGIGSDEIENINLYNEGGHHPVHLGDVLNGKYEVVHKLGSGGFGLVWLCHDTVAKKWRAVKIMTAEHSIESREEKIYNHLLQRSSLKELRKGHILIPLERFWIEGPNGRHYCIVLPVLGPPVTFWLDMIQSKRAKPEQILPDSKMICTEIAQAVRLLHRLEVCHGDLKPQNIMMGVEGLDDLDKPKMLELLGVPETYEVETESGRPPAPRAPNYIVLPPHEPWWEKFVTSSVSIIDFGASFLIDEPPDINGMSLGYAAPEVIWGTAFPPGPPSDIWSLAATFFEIINGHIVQSFEYFLGGLPEPYRRIHRAEWRAANGRPSLETSDEDLDESQPMNEAAWRNFPLKCGYDTLLQRRTARAKETDYTDHFEADLGRERRYLPNILRNDVTDEEQHTAIKYKYRRKDVVELTDLFRKMLRYDPAKRITINDVIHHPSLNRWSLPYIITNAIRDRISLSSYIFVDNEDHIS